MTESEEVDIYGDLDDIDLERTIKSLQIDNAKFVKEAESFNLQISSLKKQVADLSAENATLKTNFSSLMLTAKNEISRKDNIIAELRREKDQILFRRGKNANSDKIHSQKPNENIILSTEDIKVHSETQNENISMDIDPVIPKRKIGIEEYRNIKRVRIDTTPDTTPFIKVKPNVIVNNVNEITMEIRRRKKPSSKTLQKHSTPLGSIETIETVHNEIIKISDHIKHEILESNNSDYHKTHDELKTPTSSERDTNVRLTSPIIKSETHETSELHGNQLGATDKFCSNKPYETVNDSKHLISKTHEKESDFRIERRRDPESHENRFKLDETNVQKTHERAMNTRLDRRHDSKIHESERDSESKRMRNQRYYYEKDLRPEIKHNNRTRDKYDKRLECKIEERRRGSYEDRRTGSGRDSRDKGIIDYKSRNDDRVKDIICDRNDRNSNHKGGRFLKEDYRRSGRESDSRRRSRSRSRDRRSYSNLNKRNPDHLIDLREKLKKQLKDIDKEDNLKSTRRIQYHEPERHRKENKFSVHGKSNIKLHADVEDSVNRRDDTNLDNESDVNIDDSIINMYDNMDDEIIPVYVYDHTLRNDEETKILQMLKSELSISKNENDDLEKVRINQNGKDNTVKKSSVVNATSETNKETEINHESNKPTSNRSTEDAFRDNLSSKKLKKTKEMETNKTNQQLPTVQTATTDTGKIVKKPSKEPLILESIVTTDKIKSENIATESIKIDEKVQNAKNTKTNLVQNKAEKFQKNKNANKSHSTDVIKDLFGESPIKSVNDVNKNMNICKYNLANDDSRKIKLDNEEINNVEKNPGRSEEIVLLEQAIASITGDSYVNNIKDSSPVQESGETVYNNAREITTLEQETACNIVRDITTLDQESAYNNVDESTTQQQRETLFKDVADLSDSSTKPNSVISTNNSTYALTVVDKNVTIFSIKRRQKKKKPK